MKPSRNAVSIACILCVSVIVLGRQLVTPAVFSCLREDTLFYLSWSRQFADSLAAGFWYPRWMPDSHGGYGNPTFIFYPPLVIYLTAVSKLVTGDIVISVTLIKLLGLFLSGLFMYIFIKDVWGGRAGLVAAAVYIALPFRVFDLYFLGVYASKFAYVWFPLILYFTRKTVTEERMGRGTAGLAASYALLCVTHLLSAYMFLPVTAAFGLVAAGRGGLYRALSRLFAAGFLGISLSAFYIVPVVLERGLVHFEMLLNDEIYHYYNNYLFFILRPVSPYNPQFYRFLAVTVVSSAALSLSVYMLSRPSIKERRGPFPLFFMALLGFTLFIMSSPSGFLWAVVPGMGQLQFPTRWASVLVFGAACIAGAGAGFMDKNRPGLKKVAISIWLPFFILSAAVALYYDAEIIRNGCCFTRADLAELPGTLDVEEYVPKGVSLKWLRAEATRYDIGKIVPLQAGNTVKLYINGWAPERREFIVEAAQETRLRIKTFYYPGWECTVGGRPAPLSAEDKSGAILLTVPKGRNNVILSFSDTAGRRLSKFFSGIAAGIFLFLLGGLRPRHG